MIDPKLFNTQPETVKSKTAQRGAEFDFERAAALDEERKRIIGEVESLKNIRNKTSKDIGKVIKEGGNVADVQKQMKELGEEISTLDSRLSEVQDELKSLMLTLPNLIDDSVPEGSDESDNKLLHDWGSKKEFEFSPKPHWEIAEDLNIVDFERGVKVAKSRFSAYRGLGARLERALISFMLDIHTDNGYTEVMTPFLVNSDALQGTGQLPKFEEDLFKCERDGLYLIPTAEVPVTNLYAQEIIDEDKLPVCHAAYSPCFRREAGAHGQDTRGLIRQHQFNKVELVKIVHPDNAWEELEKLLADAEGILKKLDIHYRVMTLCSGDLGFSASKTYDIEVWLPGQECYREISSCSCFTDFQARRAGIKFRRKSDNKAQIAYTLNGSGLAVGRTFLAILENYQQEDGSVIIPEALRPYMGGLEKIEKQEL